jgi:hypothetical protein
MWVNDRAAVEQRHRRGEGDRAIATSKSGGLGLVA